MEHKDDTDVNDFSKSVREKARRKLNALRRDNNNVWFGLSMMGNVGWSIVVPTLLGAALGLWIDGKYPDTISWTLTGLTLGLFAGCLIAWYWINKEHKEINQNDEDE